MRADGAALPFAPARFDAVVGVHVFHLIPRWRETLAEAARVLRPGGVLLHGADDQSAVWSRWRSRLDDEIEYEHPGVPRARFETFPEEEGWRPRAIRKLAFVRRIRPQDLVDRLAQRTWSVTWRMSEAALARAVETLRSDLVQRFGALDREVDVESGFWVRAYERQ